MERKVGEIFEYNGEWYQCMEGTGCYRCAFYDKNICIADNPHCTCRSDKKNVIFKKLEKVGDPYVAYGLTRQKYKLHVPLVITNEILDEDISCDEVNGIIDIRAKQNKEDMKEEKLNLKEFNLEAAKAGKPVCTRDGRKVRIICFDAECNKPIVALIYDCNKETVFQYLKSGRFFVDQIDKYDLMMLPQKKEGWVNIYKDFEDTVCCIYSTEKEALEEKETEEDYITTVKIEWEE
jgi:hypothetical protein